MSKMPEGNDWEMIVFDIDGTLLDLDGFQPKLIPLIRQIENMGITVSLASGRTLPNVTPIQQVLAISGFAIGENGGMVWDSKAGFPIRCLADGKRTRDAAKWLATQIEGLDPKGIETNRWRETEWCLLDTENYERMKEALEDSQWPDLRVVPTGFAVHITEKELNKATGLKVAFEQRGIDPSKVIAVGDASNDIPMFEMCGFSVAVNNEFRGVEEAANYLTKAKGTLGTIEFLEEFIMARK
ncbi:phosphoglycolate phosphatase [Euryarchaeota archaeon]|nr:phosphoglycolate phosphatase [Euryarchaeota archaeon]